MTRTLSRLLRPHSIAVIGGGAWAAQVIGQSRRMGFDGAIWPVHPKATEIAGVPVLARLSDLPGAPDAAFVGINRHASIDVVASLAAMGAGGAVCFASGFAEAAAEDATGRDLQAALVAAAGDMPILGPNCYGLINALDGALLWPDQHGCRRVEQGVAILTQSSNIAINLTMQRRAVPLAYVVTLGNAAQTGQAAVARALLDDPRVTAIGLHVEGFGELRAWEGFAARAAARGVPVVAIKVGRSQAAQSATVSHTASLAGSEAGADALIRRLGFGRAEDLPTFLETLKLLHFGGALRGPGLASVSCSGGEASLAADTAQGRGVHFPALRADQHSTLRAVLGPMVALANPLDYHTYIWRDVPAMAATFGAMTGGDVALTLIIADYPHTDARDWACVTEAAIAARAATGARIAVVATLPELLPADVAADLIAGGVIPLQGLTEAIRAAEIAAHLAPPCPDPLLLPGPPRAAGLLDEATAKARLAASGVPVPRGIRARAALAEAAQGLQAPLALKGLGFAHKSEAGAVALNLSHEALEAAARVMPGEDFLIEEMVTGSVAELLVGVTRDPAHGFCLTLGAGGVLTEIMADTATLLIPARRDAIRAALLGLRIAPLLTGYRGKPAAALDAVLDAVLAIQSYVQAHADCIEELEVNPLICTPDAAIAADALIKESPE